MTEGIVRQILAVELRVAGRSYKDICKSLGYDSVDVAREDVQSFIEEAKKNVPRTVKSYLVNCKECSLKETFEFSGAGWESLQKKVTTHMRETGHGVGLSVKENSSGSDAW